MTLNVRCLTTCLCTAMLALGLMANPDQAQAQWSQDVPESLATAQAEQKDVLMNFSGSDWCGYCIELDKEVFSQDGFTNEAGKSFVLVTLDFPQDIEQPANLIEQNETWSRRLNIEGFPTVVLLDAQGRPYAQTGYQSGGVAPYLDHLKSLQASRVARDALLAEAANSSGADKARQLDQALAQIPGQYLINFYRPQVDMIIEADADDAAGLHSKYSAMLKDAELEQKVYGVVDLYQEGKVAEALTALDTLIADDTTWNAPQRQGLMMTRAMIMLDQGQTDDVAALVDRALALDPQSPLAAQIQQFKAQLPMFITAIEQQRQQQGQ